MDPSFANRRREVVRKLTADSLDALFVTGAANRYYLTGFTGDSGNVIVHKRGTVLVTDARFRTQAREETSGIRIVVQRRPLAEATGEELKSVGARRVGFDPEGLTVGQFRRGKKASGAARKWKPAPGLVENLRSRKSPAELEQMRKAARLAGDVLEGVLKLLKPGVRESEISAEIEYRMRQRGASGPSFESIVAFGERSALPHARPTNRKLRKNELVVLDLGVILGHYCSDITRTVFVGKAPARIRRWYEAVLEAHQAAIAATKAHATCGQVDNAAREVLAGYRLEKQFVHSTGHGLGLEVHEEPRVARGEKQLLAAGNVITVEPGVYVAGVGGIRIEDDVAIHPDATEVLTRIPRDFIEL